MRKLLILTMGLTMAAGLTGCTGQGWRPGQLLFGNRQVPCCQTVAPMCCENYESPMYSAGSPIITSAPAAPCCGE